MAGEISELMKSLKSLGVETLIGEFRAGDVYLSNKGNRKPSEITTDSEELIEIAVFDLFQEFYEDEGLDIDDCYGSFEILCNLNKIKLTIHYETEENISLNFPFMVQDFAVCDRKITFNISSISENPSLLLTDDEAKISLPTKDEFKKIFQETPDRIKIFVVGMGGDGYSQLVSAEEIITIKPDERYDWDFSDEIEAVFLAVDFDLSKLRSLREIDG